jgi:hypothetical protein
MASTAMVIMDDFSSRLTQQPYADSLTALPL